MMGLGIPPELNGSDALSNNCPIALRPKDTPKAYKHCHALAFRPPRIGYGDFVTTLIRDASTLQFFQQPFDNDPITASIQSHYHSK